ncbi:C2 calcium-dependent domain-containing protein 4C [Acipenser ruthenus]|uniref:C2 calcium-dependent domain-containing protein 4C n=1 Tax=Acipenser ruthenus TaxID=7906 RepID=A0A662YWQ3_ACIRT|nr:C2 calcium-dependent domain-containing protein 4C [Acipenser ruthenus]
MLSTSSQVSLKSAIDSMLSWSSLKPRKTRCTKDLGKPPCPKSKDIFSIVVTPDRIPKFFIPSLDVEHFLVQVCTEGDQPQSKWKSGSEQLKESGCWARSDSNPCKTSNKKTLCKNMSIQSFDGPLFPLDLEQVADHSDPATRGALSLPHLAKVTTPYGFLALGESPNIRRKESMFFEQDPNDIRTLLSQRKKSNSLSRSCSSPLSSSKQQLPVQSEETLALPIRSSRSVSWDAICKDSLSSSPFPQSPKPEKNKFQSLIKKHISSIKRMRPGSTSVLKASSSVGRVA